MGKTLFFLLIFYHKFIHDLIWPTFAWSEASQSNEVCGKQQKSRMNCLKEQFGCQNKWKKVFFEIGFKGL